MPTRWWGRAIGLAIVCVVLADSTSSATAGWELVGRTPDGTVVLRLPLRDGRFSLEYRNSLYGSRAAEHFRITDDGRLSLVGLAAADAAVLHEYYGATGPRRPMTGSRGDWWEASPTSRLELSSLTVAATRHGERTLVTDGGTAIELWRAVVGHGSGPGITLQARRSG